MERMPLPRGTQLNRSFYGLIFIFVAVLSAHVAAQPAPEQTVDAPGTAPGASVRRIPIPIFAPSHEDDAPASSGEAKPSKPDQTEDREEPPVRQPIEIKAVAPSNAPRDLQPVERHGVTVELNVGYGSVWPSVNGMSADQQHGLAGVDLGVGGWATSQVAVFGRIAGTSVQLEDGLQLITGVIGPALQIWPNDHAWFGLGAGLGFIQLSKSGASQTERGWGLDLRAGVTLNRESENTVSVSVEYIPTFFDIAGSRDDVDVHALCVLLGYQHL